MTLKNLNISTDTQDSMDLLLSPLQESGLKQLIISYHSNKVREIIADNTDEFSVFHYGFIEQFMIVKIYLFKH